MNEDESLVHQALTSLHPALADLYARGAEFVKEPDRPGQVHLIAHIGREISSSFLEFVASELPSEQPFVPPIVLDGLSAERESMRLGIGRALGLAPYHPVVGAWYRTHRVFVDRAHVPRDGRARDPAEVVDAFRRLTELLWARLAPYFAADDELVALVAHPPEATALETVHALFLRPQLRGRFFALCHSPEWVGFLDNAGFFSYPPEVDEAVDIVAVPWPEGTALMNVAASAPELVARIILERIPRDNRNPAVADRILRAIELLPMDALPPLLGRFIELVRRGNARYAGPAGLSVAGKLATAGHPRAVDVAKAMLSLRHLAVVDDSRPYRSISPPTYALLEAVDEHYVLKLLREVVPILGTVHPSPLARCLIVRLDRAERLIAEAGYKDGGFSHHWLSNWNKSGRMRDDLRADLARAIDMVASTALVDAPERFEEFDTFVRDRSSDLMRRLHLRFMIAAGPVAAGGAIDEVVGSEWVLEPDFGAREVAELLRRHFETASEQCRVAFARRLEAGPSDERIKSHFEWANEDPDTESARAEFVARWQVIRLRWFHDVLPRELHPLAQRIGHTPAAVDQQRQDLDEVGHWSSGAVWAGDESPKSVEELRDMSTTEFVDFLGKWSPTAAERFDGPNREGLAARLRQLLIEGLAGHGALLHQLATRRGLDPAYQSAALAACADSIKGAPGPNIPWSDALTLIRVVIEAEPPETTDDRTALWARREGLRCLVEACRSGIPLDGLWHEIASIINSAVASVPSWSHFASNEYSDFESVGSAALNTDAGVVADLVVTSCRVLNEGEGRLAEPRKATLHGWLDAILSWNGSHGVAARWQIGRHFPKLLHYMDDWVSSHEEELLRNGMIEAITSPVWGAYLTSYSLYENLYRRLEPWYRTHVTDIGLLRAMERDAIGSRANVSIARSLLEHIGMGLLRGVIVFDGDNDAGLSAVFANAGGADRAHFAWGVMRALDDVDGPLQEGFTDRVLEFWRWRLDVLADSTDPDDAKELDALGWFIRIEQLPAEAIADYALRTLEGHSSVFRVRGHVWARMPQFVVCDPIKAVRMTEILIDVTLAGESPYVDFAEVSPVLVALLGSRHEASVSRATAAVNKLGEAGWSEFRQLLG